MENEPKDKISSGPIFVIPGQGDNPAGALRPLYGSDPVARAVIDETFGTVETATLASGYDFDARIVRKLLLGEASPDTIPVGVPQLSAFVTAVCVHRVLGRQGIHPSAIIGQSMGEIASLVCADVWTLADGVRAVHALNTAFRPFEGHGGMVAVTASEADTLTLLNTVGDDQLAIACVNAPRQTVVSGPNQALDALTIVARSNGLKLHKLPVPYPAHHPALQPASDAFHKLIAPLQRHSFSVPVFSAVARRRYNELDDLPRLMADCFTKPYHMPATLETVHKGEDVLYVDLSMTGIMSRCIRAISPNANVAVPTRLKGQSLLEGRTSNEHILI